MKSSWIMAASAIATIAVGAGCKYTSVLVADSTHPGGGSSIGAAPSQKAPTVTTTPSNDTGPIILNSFDANPTNVVTKSDKITFTVNAYSTNKAAMEYSWSTTKGTLSGTRGQTVFWTPQKTDGSLESGTATVQVLITDTDGAVKKADVNLQIAADGSATVK
ncbi:MAG: hypothetical protein FJZ00_05535 [Candidatus Sericytochromatia bacterium]|uniref:Dystroglycan-type cadherin-like domain-containing protein n=1 Tax=Candidatus Tanganyikabacteria bacterium TaxID=2961651 RepID=A0A937X5K2_9BACT|nr:hypothetical protein [Candidatus Tanganyikabacteria bacterium]